MKKNCEQSESNDKFAVGSDTAELLNILKDTDRIFERVHKIFNEEKYVNTDIILSGFDTKFHALKRELKTMLSDEIDRNLSNVNAIGEITI